MADGKKWSKEQVAFQLASARLLKWASHIEDTLNQPGTPTIQRLSELATRYHSLEDKLKRATLALCPNNDPNPMGSIHREEDFLALLGSRSTLYAILGRIREASAVPDQGSEGS